MIDIDKMKITAELSIEKENSVFVEYQFDFALGEAKFGALFSLKHKQATLTANKSRNAFNFVENISNKVLREMARQLGCRLFLVIHGDNENPPFDIFEIDVAHGTHIRRAYISGQTKEAWETCWKELGLLK